jgi:hypothetical protein
MKINVLDVSRFGNLTANYSDQLNQVSDRIRRDYITMVDDLSVTYDSDLHWFTTPFACRNTSVCSVFDEVTKFFFVKEVLSVDENIDTIVVDSPILAKVLRLNIENKNLTILSQKSLTGYYVSLIFQVGLGLFKYVLASMFRYFSFKLAILFAPNKVNNFEKKITIIETYIYKSSFKDGEFNDRHFFNIQSHLKEQDKQRVVYLPFFYGKINYFSLYLKAIKSKFNFIFVEEYTSFMDIILYPIKNIFKLKYNHSDINLYGVDFSKLVNHSIFRHSTKPSSLYSLLKYRFSTNLKKNRSIVINRIVRWYENLEIDHGSIMGWRAYSPSLYIFGYMDLFVSKNYLSPYPSQVEYNLNIVPDSIGVIGEGLIDQHKKFCHELNVVLAPSFRFSKPKLNIRKDRLEQETINILVSLPLSISRIRIIVDILENFVRLNCTRKVSFIVKLHPASDYVFNLANGENIEFNVVNTNFNQLVRNVDFVLSSASSTLVEAFMFGAYALVSSSTQELSDNTLPEFIPNDYWRAVYNAQELADIVKHYTQKGVENREEISSINAMIVGQPPNEKNVRTMLGFI